MTASFSVMKFDVLLQIEAICDLQMPESINNQTAWPFTLVHTQKLTEFPVVAAIICVNPLFDVGPTSITFV